jgi:hypothetical protein
MMLNGLDKSHVGSFFATVWSPGVWVVIDKLVSEVLLSTIPEQWETVIDVSCC